MSSNSTGTQSAAEEVRWTDASIRWPDDKPIDNEPNTEDDYEAPYMDPFKDPNPFQEFSFRFDRHSNILLHGDDKKRIDDDRYIDIGLRGYKTDSDQVFESTGLTIWKSAKHLCQYQMSHSKLFHGKRILELGAGLGLNGILAYCMTQDSTICITDGDTDSLNNLRENIDLNRQEKFTSKISCHQLIWNRSNAALFLENHAESQTFDVMLASDIIYAKGIIEPLWATVQVLLARSGVFVMAYASRNYVPINIEYVLELSVNAGFEYELAEEDTENEIFVYLFRWKDDEIIP
mmetsp:Transcript_22178/g.33636  ORF Transcript_22178/g.33636 Transcript_22178/m.33636 type:complete len:291 (+) Transcript_22178:30-902(+)